ncbi:hypothetical protein R5R35_011598 [Gryllus longicercus]|uniref:ZP domain-containing protein n=1 Tax=Gryllus longicercus TaxID=2509291 RepID=A0AAN9Z4U0_9ORTH
MVNILNLLLLFALLNESSGQICNATQTFIKSRSVTLNSNFSVLLFNNPGNAVTAECQQRCLASRNCAGFLVDYTDASCFRAMTNESVINKEPTIPGITTSYYEKSCLNVPRSCGNKLWTLERVDGYELVGFSRTVIPNIQLGAHCGQLCLSETNFACRSAMYFADRKACSLSSEDRRTQPSSYRATIWSTQYWENQCAPNVFSDTSCSLEEYANSTICCADNKEENVTQFQCQQRCNNETSFNCRGFTYIPARGDSEASYCLLHGDDSSSIGPRGVQFLAGATYWEKVPCLPLQVTCTSAGMNVILRSQNFRGRMYVVGHSEECYIQGRQGRDVTLKIPLQRQGREINTCGVMMAHSIGETNRTLLSAVVMVQFNPIIQRRGDRAVKVGCLLDSSSSKNVTLGVSLSFSGSNDSQGGTVVVNSTTIPPTVSLRIADRFHPNEELQEVVLGQNLQLKVDVMPENSTFDIHVFNLIATSNDGAESYLLLDNRGCPSSPDFSPLRRLRPGSRSLVGDFRAFKFPNSDVVRFRATVHFCPDTCPPVDCVVSLGRKRRQAPPSRSEFEELPVQLAIVVRVPESESNALHSTESDVCMSWGTLLGIILAWILLQFLILGTWFFVLHFRRVQRQDETKLQDDFAGYDNRHVHWADT